MPRTNNVNLQIQQGFYYLTSCYWYKFIAKSFKLCSMWGGSWLDVNILHCPRMSQNSGVYSRFFWPNHRTCSSQVVTLVHRNRTPFSTTGVSSSDRVIIYLNADGCNLILLTQFSVNDEWIILKKEQFECSKQASNVRPSERKFRLSVAQLHCIWLLHARNMLHADRIYTALLP